MISTESLENPLHLVVIVGAKRGRPDVAPRASLQQEGGSALVVGGFDDADQVVRTHGPVELQAPPCFWAAPAPRVHISKEPEPLNLGPRPEKLLTVLDTARAAIPPAAEGLDDLFAVVIYGTEEYPPPKGSRSSSFAPASDLHGQCTPLALDSSRPQSPPFLWAGSRGATSTRGANLSYTSYILIQYT
jgi:hypothetical protein